MTTDARQERGRLLAKAHEQRIRHVEGAMWFVPSAAAGGHLVNVAAGTCSCPDFQQHPQHPTKCKHLWAVELVRGSGRAEPAIVQAAPEAAKVPPAKLGRMADFTPQEQEHIRKALRFLRIRCGGWGPLAKALRLNAGTIQPMQHCQKVSARLAVRLARFAGVALEAVLAGTYPPSATCPHCGYRPGTGAAELPAPARPDTSNAAQRQEGESKC